MSHKIQHAAYSLIFSIWAANFASFDFCSSWAIVAMIDPAINRMNVATGKIARRNRYACRRRRGGPMAEARNDREGSFSRARDRFTVTSYVSALHIPGPCPETIWIPNTSYHNRRFKVPDGRWSRIPNRIIGPGSRPELRNNVRSRIRSTLESRSSYRPMADQVLPLNLGQLFLMPRPTPFFVKRDLLTYMATGNPKGDVREKWVPRIVTFRGPVVYLQKTNVMRSERK